MGFGIGYEMSFFDTLFPLFFIVIFVLVIGTFIATAVRGVSTWNKNNQSPVLTVDAVVVAKREQFSHHHHDTGYHTYTYYFVTFQVQSGDRIELEMEGTDYGMLCEGDRGQLTFQGTRYKGFARRVGVFEAQ